jgi:hypothetical protein
MRTTVARLGPVVALMSVVMLVTAPEAFAHEHRHVDGLDLTVGWGVEPAVAGFPNSVQFIAAHANGTPAEGGTVQAEALFGDKDSTQKSQPIDLVPSDETPGEYEGFIIPTRPGTYTFHITGIIGSTNLDEFFTSSETTFDDVADPQGAQFPAKDPTAGQLSQKIDRLDGRLAAVQKAAVSAATSAGDAARTARVLAIVGIALGALALSTALALSRSSRRSGSNRPARG